LPVAVRSVAQHTTQPWCAGEVQALQRAAGAADCELVLGGVARGASRLDDEATTYLPQHSTFKAGRACQLFPVPASFPPPMSIAVIGSGR